MTTYIALICLSLTLIIVTYFLYSKIQSRALAKKAEVAFENVYKHSLPRPKYAMEYRYGYPHFTVTFGSDKELATANEEGFNKRFSREIEEICKNTGSKERPFRVEDGITFISEEYLKNIQRAGI